MHRGSQTPRLEHVPPSPSSAGQDVAEFAASAGLILDPWQQHVLEGALGEREDGRWQSSNVVLIVSRQNGKGAVLEALVLAWLFLFDEPKVLFSAHELKTAVEMFKRIRDLIKATPDLDRQVAHFYQSNEKTSIELHDGRECRFMARSKGSGRGFSATKIVFDEAYNLPDDIHDAQKPTTGAQDNPQTWYTSSAGDKDIAPCDVLARMRRLGLAQDGRTYFAEWSVPYDEDTLRIQGDPSDPRLWAVANPSMGIRKREETISDLQRSMSPVGFAREELGVGNWPDPDAAGDALPYKVWLTLADPGAERGRTVWFGVDVAEDRSAWIAVAWRRDDGHVQTMLANDGNALTASEVVGEVVRLHRLWGGLVVPPRSLEDELSQAGVLMVKASAADFTAACGSVADEVSARTIRHGNQANLNAAVKVAKWRSAGSMGERAFQLRDFPEVGPLAAVVRAVHGLSGDIEYDPMGSVL